MFIFNLKLNGNKTIKILMTVLCIIILLITFYICYNLLTNNYFQTNDEYISSDVVYELNTKNYTNVLQNVHNYNGAVTSTELDEFDAVRSNGNKHKK